MKIKKLNESMRPSQTTLDDCLQDYLNNAFGYNGVEDYVDTQYPMHPQEFKAEVVNYIKERKTENLKEAFKPSNSGIQSVKVYNPYNYTIQELRVDNDNKTFERGNFTAGKADKKTKNRQEYEDIVDTLKELGYTEIKSDYRSLRNKTRKGIPTNVEEGYELSPRIDYNPNHLRDDEGKIMADKWYASKWPDDEVGIEQLFGITLDDALKDRSILGHCDTQVRERVYTQLDKYIPLSIDSPMYKEKNESKSVKEDVSNDIMNMTREVKRYTPKVIELANIYRETNQESSIRGNWYDRFRLSVDCNYIPKKETNTYGSMSSDTYLYIEYMSKAGEFEKYSLYLSDKGEIFIEWDPAYTMQTGYSNYYIKCALGHFLSSADEVIEKLLKIMAPESKSIKESSYKKGDRVVLDNGMTGTVTKDFDWENEDQVSVEIDGTGEMRYPLSYGLKELNESKSINEDIEDKPLSSYACEWSMFNNQAETLDFIESLEKQLGYEFMFGAKIGKEPQTVVLDYLKNDNMIYVYPNGSLKINNMEIGDPEADYDEFELDRHKDEIIKAIQSIEKYRNESKSINEEYVDIDWEEVGEWFTQHYCEIECYDGGCKATDNGNDLIYSIFRNGDNLEFHLIDIPTNKSVYTTADIEELYSATGVIHFIRENEEYLIDRLNSQLKESKSINEDSIDLEIAKPSSEDSYRFAISKRIVLNSFDNVKVIKNNDDTLTFESGIRYVEMKHIDKRHFSLKIYNTFTGTSKEMTFDNYDNDLSFQIREFANSVNESKSIDESRDSDILNIKGNIKDNLVLDNYMGTGNSNYNDYQIELFHDSDNYGGSPWWYVISKSGNILTKKCYGDSLSNTLYSIAQFIYNLESKSIDEGYIDASDVAGWNQMFPGEKFSSIGEYKGYTYGELISPKDVSGWYLIDGPDDIVIGNLSDNTYNSKQELMSALRTEIHRLSLTESKSIKEDILPNTMKEIEWLLDGIINIGPDDKINDQDDWKRLHTTASRIKKQLDKETLKESSYGGAFDIKDDQYFTREDLDNFAEEVLNHINETFITQFDVSACYIDDGILELEVTNDEYGDYSWSEKIDMRKIKEPWHLKKVYATWFASQLINDITQQNNGLIESLKESVTDDAQPIETGAAVGMAAILSDLIKDEYEAIDAYNSAIATADAEGFGDMVNVLTEIQAEENIHVGQLQELMKIVDPNATKIEDGYVEAEEQLSNPSINPDDIVDDDFRSIDEEFDVSVDDISDDDVGAAIKAVEEAMNSTDAKFELGDIQFPEEDEVIIEATEPWEDIYKSFKDIEVQLNGDGEAITALIDRMYNENKENPDFEKAYKKWASNE